MLRLLLLAMLAILAVRAGQLATVNPDAVSQGLRQIHTRITLPSARGLILDREHRELAISVYAPSVYVFPKLLGDRDAAARALAKALSSDVATISRKLAARDGFTYLARWIEPAQAERILALGLPGVGIENEPRRTYPASAMAAPLIGFADIDGQGVRGVEQMMDAWLKGQPRTLAVERDATGRLLASDTVDPRVTAGGDIALTLDAGLQAQAEAALSLAVESTGSKGGLVIAVDPRTGDILTLVEAPGFDPNDFRHTAFERTRSRVFLDAIEPGSTMKAFLVAAALESGAIDRHSVIDTGDGFVRLPGKTIRDHHPYGVIDPAGLLQFSSNVGAVWVGQRLGGERFHAALLRFGFSKATGSGFPQESNGLLRDWRSWRQIDEATVAFGQGVNVTPIQLAMATAALANDGLLMRPRLVAERRPPMGRWESLPVESVGQAVSPAVARELRGMLQNVVGPEGTGRLAGLAGIPVAGKTGTAQVYDPATKTYSQNRYTAWFVGMAPADDPRIAIVVALDEPQGIAHTGGAVAAPLFALVATSQLAHQGIVTRPEPIPPIQVPSWVAVQERIDARKRALGGSLASRMPEQAAKERTVQPVPTIAVTPRTTATRAVSAPPQPRVTAVSAIPQVAAAPPAARTVHARSDLDPFRTVMVPDFRGQTIDAARRIAAAESLDVRIQGAGGDRVASQSPAAGSIVDGRERTITLNLAHARGEG